MRRTTFYSLISALSLWVGSINFYYNAYTIYVRLFFFGGGALFEKNIGAQTSETVIATHLAVLVQRVGALVAQSQFQHPLGFCPKMHSCTLPTEPPPNVKNSTLCCGNFAPCWILGASSNRHN